MKLQRVIFQREVPSPAAPSVARTNWWSSFEGAKFLITRSGDTVSIGCQETGRTFLYPWDSVAAAEPALPEAPPPVVTHAKRQRT